jgi:hypothetical protein
MLPTLHDATYEFKSCVCMLYDMIHTSNLSGTMKILLGTSRRSYLMCSHIKFKQLSALKFATIYNGGHYVDIQSKVEELEELHQLKSRQNERRRYSRIIRSSHGFNC